MYTIQKTNYGLRVTMGGAYEAEEMKRYLIEKEALLSQYDGPISILVDLSSAIPQEKADVNLLAQSHAKMKERNLLRMVYIVASPVIRMQLRQILMSAHVIGCTRIIDAKDTPNWETQALDWLLRGIEPGQQSSSAERGADPNKYIASFSRKF